MNALDMDAACQYVNDNINDFHQRKVRSLEELKLEKLLTKNPYLYRAKNILNANDLIMNLLDAFLSSSEEKLFGDFLEGLAIYIAERTCNGHKSAAPGVDLEFIHRGIHYVISVKSGPSWGNSSQQSKLEQDLKNAVTRVKQSKRGANVQPVLGICYGRTKTSYLRGYMKVVGQNFWYLISGNKDLYMDIVEPIGYKAQEHNERFIEEKTKVINRLTKHLLDKYSDESGSLDWKKIVQINCGNFDLDTFLAEE